LVVATLASFALYDFEFYICTVRYLIILYAFAFATCQSKTEEARLKETLEGDWLVLVADHQLENEDQRQIYGKMQDSVVEAKCLKLIRFFENGNFQQVDYPEVTGKWAISPDLDIYMGNGGKGFDYFKVKYLSYRDKQLQLRENLHTQGETIKVDWYFKKLTNGILLDKSRNEWRKKPTAAESEKEIRIRLGKMLDYYSRYFELVADESSFFIGKRVILPLRYYQHAMSTVPYDPESDFAKLFFNPAQSEQAYGYLKSMVYGLGNKYPRDKNYVIEYSRYLKQVGEAIQRYD
jgi:hypothetical protein